MELDRILQGNNLEVMPKLPASFFHCCVTSPPYWGLRDYGLPETSWPEVTYTPMSGLPPITVSEWTGCLGLEPTLEMFVGHMVLVFREVWRLLRDDGTLWINFGDSYAKAGTSGMGDPTIGERNLGGMKPIAKKVPAGLKPKDLTGVPWRVAFALQADGWYLRMDNIEEVEFYCPCGCGHKMQERIWRYSQDRDIIWSKPNPMPESVTDRPTKSHEYLFLFSKSERYYYDNDAVKEPMAGSSVSRLSQDIESQQGSLRANGGAKTNGPMKAVRAKGNSRTFRGGGKYTGGQSFDNSQVVERESRGNVENKSGLRNKRSVWTIATQSFSEAHFATFPPKLIEPCILAGSPQGGIVIDPFMGSGTTAVVARNNGRKYIGIEMNWEYIELAERRIQRETAQMNIFEFGT